VFTWHCNIEVVLTEVTTSVGGLHNHLLALNWARCEGQPRDEMSAMLVYYGLNRQLLLVAGTTPVTLSLARQLHGSETVSELIIDSPRALVRAHICLSTALTGVLSSHVGEWVV
jgi:hypothetical protein